MLYKITYIFYNQFTPHSIINQEVFKQALKELKLKRNKITELFLGKKTLLFNLFIERFRIR